MKLALFKRRGELHSSGVTAQAGDVIVTGTPAGVGIGFHPTRYLRRGDRIRIEIREIGSLENSVE